MGNALFGLAVATAIVVALVVAGAGSWTTSTTITSATKMITNVGATLDLATSTSGRAIRWRRSLAGAGRYQIGKGGCGLWRAQPPPSEPVFESGGQGGVGV